MWQGCIEWNGYGRTFYKGQNWLVHRAFFDYYVGAVPEGCDVHHRCGNRACVNPEHLEALDRFDHVHADIKKARDAGAVLTHECERCGGSMEGKRPDARFCSDACRIRHWKDANESPTERRRTADRRRKQEARTRGVIRSDVRVSFDKALHTVAERIYMNAAAGVSREDAEVQAWWALHDALPERLQRHV